MVSKYIWLTLAFLPALPGQGQPELQQILNRLEKLEQENRNLAAEVHSLRQELAASRPQPAGQTPPLEERVAVEEQRIDDLAQTKVEAAQKLPISLTGMVLFNAYLNGRNSTGREYPGFAGPNPGSAGEGATINQSILGLRYSGGEIPGGGKVTASLFMDLSSGNLRLRTGSVNVDWGDTSLLVGLEKPIVAPREPVSLARVSVSPLTGSGNLWLWGPQASLEQRFHFGEQSGLRAQVGVYQTSEPTARATLQDYAVALAGSRPALEGRFEFWKQFDSQARLEFAPGFHVSTTHVAGQSVASRLLTLDWLIRPVSHVEFSGAFFAGENAAGLGGLRQGFTVFGIGRAVPIHALGGWGQLSLIATKRLTFNLFEGQENDRRMDLLIGDINRNVAFGANLIYRLGPNVLAGFEASQTQTTYVGSGVRLNNHYDLSLAYLF